MLRFAKAPDAVFQAILRDSFGYTIDFISDLLEGSGVDTTEARDDFRTFFPAAGKVFPPKLALDTLRNMQSCLDRPEIYYLNDYHYLLLYDTLNFLVETHNTGVADARSKRGKRDMMFVDPFYIEQIDFDELVELYFFDIDFLTSGEAMLNLPPWFKETYNPETFALTQGMLPHPEELALNIDTFEDPLSYKITAPRYFGPKSKVYPDYDYYDKAISC